MDTVEVVDPTHPLYSRTLPLVGVTTKTYEARLAERRYRSVDPDNRLVASELERDWEDALRSLSEAKDTAERFEREYQQTALDHALREQLDDFGRHLPELWNSGLLSMQHKKQLLRSLISRVVLSRPEPQDIVARIVWVSGAVSTLSVRTPIRRAHDLRVYDTLVGEILALNDDGYPDSKIARRLTEEGFHSARGTEGVPERFVREVRRQHKKGSVSKALKSLEKLEECWTVLGLSRELGVNRGRIYKLIYKGDLRTKRHPQTSCHLIEDDPELIADLRRRWAMKPQSGNGNTTT